ncbi:hypothetical protein WJX84_012188 [Apatococcus fuscideae]|uniref:Uncharacterized protein n=1 Tax=Apatococcus fuscideae TaxID=2026836 RepID=A0AAW1TJP4_9CHLO
METSDFSVYPLATFRYGWRLRHSLFQRHSGHAQSGNSLLSCAPGGDSGARRNSLFPGVADNIRQAGPQKSSSAV